MVLIFRFDGPVTGLSYVLREGDNFQLPTFFSAVFETIISICLVVLLNQSIIDLRKLRKIMNSGYYSYHPFGILFERLVCLFLSSYKQNCNTLTVNKVTCDKNLICCFLIKPIYYRLKQKEIEKNAGIS